MNNECLNYNYVNSSTGAWDPSIRIEPPDILPADKKHKQKIPEKFEEVLKD